MQLAKLKRIDDLRLAWKNEAYDFTRWLAEEENLSHFAEIIGLNDLELIGTEQAVGKYNADIIAKEEVTGNIVLIENQIEASDHKHLGQILTYAAGRKAKIVVWVCKKLNEEHRQALDWLNDNTSEDLNFFGVEIKLLQIEDSPLAPHFEVMVKPNEWAKDVKYGQLDAETPTRKLRLEFWDGFKGFAEKKGTALRLRKTSPEHWYDISIGSSHAHVSLKTVSRDEEIRCELWIDSAMAKQVFDQLFVEKDAIEKELGTKLDWRRLDDGKVSRVILAKGGKLDDKKDWQQQYDWMLENAEKFAKAFGNRLRAIPRE